MAFGSAPNPPSRQNGKPPRQEYLAEYLQIIQGVIQRMSTMSFMIKGWVIAVFFATMVNQGGQLPFIAAAACFWGLDAYYLAQERRFRHLYNVASKEDSTVPLFLLDMNELAKHGVEPPRARWFNTFASPTISLLHLPLIGVALWSYYERGPGKILWEQLVTEIHGLL
jgi:hypothetical protein